jgi:uncharacterized protein (TIGR03032 family)
MHPAASALSEEPWLEVTSDPGFPAWLAAHDLSIACTTYQTGKLLLLGRHPEGRLSVFERNFTRCMGLWADGQTLWLSTEYQLWRLENMLRPGGMHQGYDRLYVPKEGITTGDLDVHDVAIEKSGRLVFVATGFNCLATVDRRYSFSPLWRPPFVSALVAEDRCHLNGLALDAGAARFATAVSTDDMRDGWRANRTGGGVVVEIPSGEVVARGLSMPHSPRMHAGELWLLNSGTGYFGRIARESGEFEPIAFCPGYLRGLAVVDGFAIVGLSAARDRRNFGGLPLDAALAERKEDARCGLRVIELATGRTVHSVDFKGLVTELYDVAVLQGVVRPMALGFRSDEIKQIIAIGD